MSSPWKKVTKPVEVQNLSDIMSEELARGLQVKENIKFVEEISQNVETKNDDISSHILTQISETNVKDFCDSDAIIAKIVQCQYDKEHDDDIKLVEKKRNGTSKVSISYDNYLNIPSHLIYDSDSNEDESNIKKKDWDRFETNEKEFARISKKGYITKNGEVITKHDSTLNGRRNACRIMEFSPEFCTGDGAGFDMKLPNLVYNQLKEHNKQNQNRRNKMLDRKESHATAEMGFDEETRLILYKFINNGMLEVITGIISTGKESVVLHANCDQSYQELPNITELPKECAIKVFKTTLNEFKTRDIYIEADHRFKDRFSKQNPRKVVHMWAEKEMRNMIRLQNSKLNCPTIVCLKRHILVMSFIGKDGKAAPKIKDVTLDPEKWQSVYNEIEDIMHKLYNNAHLIHADLSEYNILWWDNKCWIIDVSQAVKPDHPHAHDFLMRDCQNVYNFFEKKGVAKIKSAEELFQHVTGFDKIDINLLEGVHPGFKLNSSHFEGVAYDNQSSSDAFEYRLMKCSEHKQIESSYDINNKADTCKKTKMLSGKNKELDMSTNFGNLVIDDRNKSVTIIDNNLNFGNEIDVPVLESDKISSSAIEKKS